MEHNADTLFKFMLETPVVQRRVQQSFHTLAKHKNAGDYDGVKALCLLSRNVRDAIPLYAQTMGLPLTWRLRKAHLDRCRRRLYDLFNSPVGMNLHRGVPALHGE
jgi:hypothetical protein